MTTINPKTLEDLEFPEVLHHLAQRCNTILGKEAAAAIKPYTDTSGLLEALGQTSEYLSSFNNENRIPNHGFDAITKELQLLAIENTVLEVSGFRRISHLCTTVSLHKKFFKKFKEYYPLLFAATENIQENSNIPTEINHIIDKFGEIRDNASVDLKRIRLDML